MKKLLLVLLTAAAATAAAGVAACNMGRTDGTADSDIKNVMPQNATEEQVTDPQFEFAPPELPMDGHAPMPPEGRVLMHNGRHPEILHNAHMNGTTGAENGAVPAPKINKKGEKRDMVTPDANMLPGTADVDATPESSAPESATENSGEKPETSSPDKPVQRRDRKNKRGKKREFRQEDSTN